MSSKPLFTTKYSFLNIYEPKETVNDPSFHYYSEPRDGLYKISLLRKSARKPLTMYYERKNIQQSSRNTMKVAYEDKSTIIDFEYFNLDQRINQGQTIINKSEMTRDSQWVKKYQPKKFIELLTDDKVNKNMLTWLKSWDHLVFHKPLNQKQKPTPNIFNRNLTNQNKYPTSAEVQQTIFNNPKKLILLAGPPGCGKTTLMRVLANHCKYEIVEINASDDRSANHLITKIEDIASNDTIRGNRRPALICLDQIDGVAEGQASGIAKVLQFIQYGRKGKRSQQNNSKEEKQGKEKVKVKANLNQKKEKERANENNDKKYQNQNQSKSQLNRPVIFICNDPFAKSLRELRSKSYVLYFSELDSEKIVKRMKQILSKEKVHIETQVLQKICEISNNDIRSAIGILQLVVKQKNINNKNPKDVVNKMKVSFTKDNQSSINQFLQQILFKKGSQQMNSKSSVSFVKSLQKKVMQIGNPSLLMQSFLQNFLHIQGVSRKIRSLTSIYKDITAEDVLIKNGFRFNGQLDAYHVIPYLGAAFHFGVDQSKKIEFPSFFFQRLRKMRINEDVLSSIYQKYPLPLKIYMKKKSLLGNYLLNLYFSMQSPTSKQTDIMRSVLIMLTYGFKFKKDRQAGGGDLFPLFSPEIDHLLTFGQRKPELKFTKAIKGLMEENYEFFKERKQMLGQAELRDNTSTMLNQLNLQSRKRRGDESDKVIKYKFLEGTGTKTTYKVKMSYFF